MLGRKDYTQDELDHARTTIDRQLAAHRTLVAAMTAATFSSDVAAVIAATSVRWAANCRSIVVRAWSSSSWV